MTARIIMQISFSDQKNKVMIPFWDLFNHKIDPDLDTYNEFDYEGDPPPKPKGHYITYAVRPIKEGEQVFMHYLKPLDPIESFSTWGFVEINEISMGFATANLTEKQKQMAASMKWTAEDFTLKDPEESQRILKYNVIGDIIAIAAQRVTPELTPNSVRKGWEMVLDQLNYRLGLFKYPAEKYRELLENSDLTDNMRLVYTQLAKEIPFLQKLKKHIETSILAE